MQPVSPKILYEHCYGRYAIAAVNVFTMEQVHGLFSAAQDSNTPVIVQITPAARNYAHPKMLRSMVQSAAEIYSRTVYAVHLDHGVEEHIDDAINDSYTSVMIDASHDDFETNIRRTTQVVWKAHARNIVVEAELGVLSGVEDDISVDDTKARYTDPAQAREFVERTGCDSLAVAVGTSHGAYKFSGVAGIRFDVLEKIQMALPAYPLVLHGSSRVSSELIQSINKYGGRLETNASGVPDDDVKKAIAFGVCKVNIATDLRLLWTSVHRRFFHEHPDLFDPVIPGKEYMKAYREFMIERFEVLGSKGKVSTLKLKQ